jgi:hypothetical protein
VTDPRDWVTPDSGTPRIGAASEPAAPSRPSGSPDPEPPAHDAAPEPDDAEPDDAELETEIPLRPLGVSEILDGAVTYIRRNPRATLGLSAVLTCVVEVVVTLAQYFFIGSQARTEVTPGVLARSVGWAFLLMGGSMVLTTYVVLLLGGLLAPVMARTLLGRATSFGRAWRLARPFLPRLLGAASLMMLILVLAVALPFAPLTATILADGPTGLRVLTAVVGVPLALVLMVSAYVWFALATPILVMERRGVIASLRRSAEIVRGRWWRTFGVLALAQVIAVLAGFVVLPMPFAVVERIVLGFDAEPAGWTLVALVAVSAIGRTVAGTLVNPFNAGVIAIFYADRRMRREAFDLELQLDRPDDPLGAWLPGPLTVAGSGPQPKVPRNSLTAPPAPPPQYPGWHR